MAAVTRNAPAPVMGAALVASPAANVAASTAQQLFDRCLDVDRQLRLLLRRKSFYDVEVRQLKTQLKDLYEGLLFKDYDYAQLQDVEQLLWKSVFYNTIEGFRQRIQSATKAGETGREALKKLTAAYMKFLDDTRLFYNELLYKLQAVYGDAGAAVELDPAPSLPKLSGSRGLRDCRVSAHRCLIYLGDVSRYKAQIARGSRSDWQVASSFYQQAGRVHPRSGNPFNQLGVIAFYLKDELRAVYYYFRSLSVAIPFLTARENLKLLFEKNRVRFAQLLSRSASKPTSINTLLDARQLLSSLSYDMSTCFVRISGILFDHINTEQFQVAQELGFEFLGQLMACNPAMELLAGAPAADNVLVHVLVLGAFSVYNTEGSAPKPRGGPAAGDLLKLNRYHHLGATVMFRYAAQLCDAASSAYASTRTHVPLAAASYLLLNWILAQPQLVMRPRNHRLHQDEVHAQTNFWKALCRLVLKYGEVARKENVAYRNKAVGALPEELEFRGFEPFRVTAADLPAETVIVGDTKVLRLTRTLQSCRGVADMMQHQLRAAARAAGNAAGAEGASPDPSAVGNFVVASSADVAGCNAGIKLFCTAVNLLYDDKPLSIPELLQPAQPVPAEPQSTQEPANASKDVSMGTASSNGQGSSPLNTGNSGMVGPRSGSSDFRTLSASVEPPIVLPADLSHIIDTPSFRPPELPSKKAADLSHIIDPPSFRPPELPSKKAFPPDAADKQARLEKMTEVHAAKPRVAAECALQSHEVLQISTAVSEADAAAGDDGEEEEEVIVFQPQSISRPPSRAPETASAVHSAHSVGAEGMSRVASAASFPVSPTLTARQEFNLFANDASLALHKLVTAGVHLDQQLSMESIRSEVSGGLNSREPAAVTPKAQPTSPDVTKVSPAARLLPEPPAEWTGQLQQLGPGPISRPFNKNAPSAFNLSGPKPTSLPQPSSMPPPPPTSLQMAAMSGAGPTASGYGYGFGAIGPQRSSVPSTPSGVTHQQPSIPAGLSLLQQLQQEDHMNSNNSNVQTPHTTTTTTPTHPSPTFPSSHESPSFSPSAQTLLHPPAETGPANAIATLLHKLQRRPLQGQSVLQPSSHSIQPGAGSGILPPQPPSPSLRGMTASPQQQLFSAGSSLGAPSRLSMASSEPLHLPTMPPAPQSSLPGPLYPPVAAVMGPSHWGGGSSVVNPAASLSSVGPVMPPPGFGDVLTLSQLEQATLAAHEESVANDQAEATAMAAVGQLLDENVAPVLVMTAPTPATTHAAGLLSHPLTFPPMPSEKFLPLTMQAKSAAPIPPSPSSIMTPAAHISQPPYHQYPGNSYPLAPNPIMHPTSAPVHQRVRQPNHPGMGPPYHVQTVGTVNPVDTIRSSLGVPAGISATASPRPPDILRASFPSLHAFSVPSLPPPTGFAPSVLDRDVANPGFSFLDILEAQHIQGPEYGAGTHLYNPATGEPVTASYPMLLPSTSLGQYRTAEPLLK